MGKIFTIIAVILMLFSGCGMMTKGAMHSAKGNLEVSDYSDVLYNLTDANFSGLSDEDKPEAAFLRARALYGLKRKAEATAILNFIIEKYSNSKFPPQARSLLRKWAKQSN